jgi:membrane protein implicated in regulation of membrane protease activity
LLALAGGGIALFIIGAALSSIDLIALGLFITMVSIAAFYVKRG